MGGIWERNGSGKESEGTGPPRRRAFGLELIAERSTISSHSIGDAPKMRRTDRGMLRNSRRERKVLDDEAGGRRGRAFRARLRLVWKGGDGKPYSGLVSRRVASGFRDVWGFAGLHRPLRGCRGARRRQNRTS